MAEHRDDHFAECRIDLDGETFVNCVFERCTFVYSGGVIPTIKDCRFGDGNVWRFEGAALQTLLMIRLIATEAPGGLSAMEQVWKELTTPGVSPTQH